MPINPTTKVSASTFQQCDGTNFTTAGVENNFAVGNGCLGVYTGIGTTFNTQPTSAIIDLKGNYPYAQISNATISAGFRIRNNLSENSQTVQFRAQPCTLNVPVGNSTDIYATPYVAAKTNYTNGDTSVSFGGFAGIKQQIGKKVSIFIEGQIYDTKKVDPSTTSINTGVTIKI